MATERVHKSLFKRVYDASLSNQAIEDSRQAAKQIGQTSFTRRRLPVEGIKIPVSGAVGEYVNDGLTLIEDVGNLLGDKILSRRGFIVGMVAFSTAVTGVWQILKDNPQLLNEGEAAAKLAPVWQDLQDLSKDYSDDELNDMVYSPFKKINLTTHQAKNALLVCDGDSDNLKNGERHNSLGSQQEGSWVQFAKDLINTGLSKLGITGNAKYANYAQPGAPASALTETQVYAGNVQLGAKTLNDMARDDPGELPPVEVMKTHPGTLIATLGLNGDDMRPTADLVLSFLDKTKTTYDSSFEAFAKNPTQGELTPHIADILLQIINSYKADKERIKTYYAKALAVYADINQYRKDNNMGDMYLIATQPIRLDETEYAPYTPLNAPRGQQGRLKLSDFGKAGKIAGRLVTLPFYQIEKPLLQDFEDTTGVQVTSLPFLTLSKMQNIYAWDGHFNELGEKWISFLFGQALSLTDEEQNNIVEFPQNGEPVLKAA